MILSIIGIIVGWLVIGFLINFIAYSDTPQHLRGNSQTAKNLHILLNVLAVIGIFIVIFS